MTQSREDLELKVKESLIQCGRKNSPENCIGTNDQWFSVGVDVLKRKLFGEDKTLLSKLLRVLIGSQPKPYLGTLENTARLLVESRMFESEQQAKELLNEIYKEDTFEFIYCRWGDGSYHGLMRYGNRALGFKRSYRQDGVESLIISDEEFESRPKHPTINDR